MSRHWKQYNEDELKKLKKLYKEISLGITEERFKELVAENFPGRSVQGVQAKMRRMNLDPSVFIVDRGKGLSATALEHLKSLYEDGFDHDAVQQEMQTKFHVGLPKEYLIQKKCEILHNGPYEYSAVEHPPGSGKMKFIPTRRKEGLKPVKISPFYAGERIIKNVHTFDMQDVDPGNLRVVETRKQQWKHDRINEQEDWLGLPRGRLLQEVPIDMLQTRDHQTCIVEALEKTGIRQAAQLAVGVVSKSQTSAEELTEAEQNLIDLIQTMDKQ